MCLSVIYRNGKDKIDWNNEDDYDQHINAGIKYQYKNKVNISNLPVHWRDTLKHWIN